MGMPITGHHVWGHVWAWQIDVKISVVGNNTSCKKVSMKNIKRKSEKLLGYPRILEVHLHDKHFHLMRTIENKK
jgi:hypothetical protein